MTKPVQGALFRKFRDQIMGVVPAQDLGPGKVKPRSGVPVSDNVDTNKSKLMKNKKTKFGPAKEVAAPQECVGEHEKRSKARPSKVTRSRIRSMTTDGRRIKDRPH